MKIINKKSVFFIVWLIVFILDAIIVYDFHRFNNLETWLQYGTVASLFVSWCLLCLVFMTTVPKYCKKLLHDYIIKVMKENEKP